MYLVFSHLASAGTASFAAATRVVIVGIDNDGKTLIQTFTSDSTGDKELEAGRLDGLAGCLQAAGFKKSNSSIDVSLAARNDAGPMEIIGGTARDTIPGVVSVKGVIVLMILVSVALAIAIGLSKHLERKPRPRGTVASTAPSIPSVDDSAVEDDGASSGSSSSSTTTARFSRAGYELRRLGSTGQAQGTGGSRGYSQLSPVGLSDSDVEDTGHAALISSEDEEPRTPPLKDRETHQNSDGERIATDPATEQLESGPSSRSAGA